MSQLTRSAYGLDAAPEHPDWRVQGACAQGTYPPDWWTTTVAADLGRAVWVCLHECPVLAVCRAWANDNRRLVDQTVYGGVYWCRPGQGGLAHPVRSSGRQPVPLNPHTLDAYPQAAS